MLVLKLIYLVVFLKWEYVDYICIINLLLTLGKRSIVKHRLLDYFLLTWASKVFC